MKPVYALIAIVLALVVGFGVGALTSGGDDSDPANTGATTGETGPAATGTEEDTTAGGVEPGDGGGDETGETSGDGTERAPESANDPRPAAPDDVIGDRPGGGGDEDPGE